MGGGYARLVVRGLGRASCQRQMNFGNMPKRPWAGLAIARTKNREPYLSILLALGHRQRQAGSAHPRAMIRQPDPNGSPRGHAPSSECKCARGLPHSPTYVANLSPAVPRGFFLPARDSLGSLFPTARYSKLSPFA